MPKTIAKGSCTRYAIDSAQLFRNIGTVNYEEYYKIWDKAQILYKLTINIIQYEDGDPVANVTLYVGKKEMSTFGDTGTWQDTYDSIYSVTGYTGTAYVLFNGDDYYITTDEGTALIDEMLAGTALVE